MNTILKMIILFFIEIYLKKAIIKHLKRLNKKDRMLGAVIGDIIGSPYEFHNIKTKNFSLFSDKCCFTDDTILTCATAEWLLTNKRPEELLKKWGDLYKHRTYENGTVSAFGQGFTNWLKSGVSYNARTNGCVMRLSPIPLMINDLKSALDKAKRLTLITHNHPESLSAVQAYIETTHMIKKKVPTSIIKKYISKKRHKCHT